MKELEKIVDSNGEPLEIVDAEAREDISEIKQSLSDLTPLEKTASGAIATFDDGSDLPMPSLKVAIEPQQDLHGYDSPWVGGAGKNKFSGASYLAYMTETNGTFSNSSTDTQTQFRFAVQAFNANGYMSGSSQVNITTPGRYYVTMTFNSAPTFLRIKHNGSQKDLSIDTPFTEIGTFTISLNVTKTDPSTVGGLEFKDVQIESGSQMTSYAPYSNICPISGWSDVNVTVADATINPTISNTYTIDLDGTRYGGTLDVISGVLTITDGYIASYNSEALPSTWISDRDVYAEGTTPTVGAEVVYKLATPQTVQLTPTQVNSLLGVNNIWANTGDLELTYFVNNSLVYAIYDMINILTS